MATRQMAETSNTPEANRAILRSAIGATPTARRGFGMADNMGRTEMTIGRLMMAGVLIAASTGAHAQQAVDASGAQAAAAAQPAAAPKKTLEEKAAMATALLAAGFAAFRTIKAATQAPAAQPPADPALQATVK